MPENENLKPSAREKAAYIVVGVLAAFSAVLAVFALISGALALDPAFVAKAEGSAARQGVLLLGSTGAALLAIGCLIPAIRFVTAYTRRYLLAGASAKKLKGFRAAKTLPREERAALNRKFRAEHKGLFLAAAAALLLGLGGLLPPLFGAGFHPALTVLYLAGFGVCGLILLFAARRNVFWLEDKKIIP